MEVAEVVEGSFRPWLSHFTGGGRIDRARSSPLGIGERCSGGRRGWAWCPVERLRLLTAGRTDPLLGALQMLASTDSRRRTIKGSLPRAHSRTRSTPTTTPSSRRKKNGHQSGINHGSRTTKRVRNRAIPGKECSPSSDQRGPARVDVLRGTLFVLRLLHLPASADKPAGRMRARGGRGRGWRSRSSRRDRRRPLNRAPTSPTKRGALRVGSWGF